MLPSHQTKHKKMLDFPFRLIQSDNGLSIGTALWLGAQVLSAYLTTLNMPPGRAIELGSGIGYSALQLASMNWDVVATDLPAIIRTVLAQNIAANDAGRRITVRELDWTLPVFSDNDVYELIITADTIYEIKLIRPLLHALACLATRSPRAQLFVCLERRDPPLIDSFFTQAHQLGFKTDQIPHRKLSRALQKSGMEWSKEDWEGVEVWKLKLKLTEINVEQ